jgi:hypothetical protein
MSDTSKNSEQKSTIYLPQTDEEKAEAFRLLDELESELAREDALRELLSESLRKELKKQSSQAPVYTEPPQVVKDFYAALRRKGELG